jgi:hypothetical protein
MLNKSSHSLDGKTLFEYSRIEKGCNIIEEQCYYRVLNLKRIQSAHPEYFFYFVYYGLNLFTVVLPE